MLELTQNIEKAKSGHQPDKLEAVISLMRFTSMDADKIEPLAVKLGAVLFQKPDFKLGDIKTGAVTPMSVIDHHYILCLRGLGLIII